MYTQGEWRLGDILGEESSGDIVDKLKQSSTSFAELKSTLSPDMSHDQFLHVLKCKEEIGRDVSRVTGHVSLQYAENTQSEEIAAMRTSMNQLSTEIANRALYFDLWWKDAVDDANAMRLADSAGDLKEYLVHMRRLAKHALSEAEEKIINTLDVTGAFALIKLYDTITNAYTYAMKVDGKDKVLNREELTTYVRSPVAEYREMAYNLLLKKYRNSRNVLGDIYHNVVLNHNNEFVKMRGYDSPISVMNAASNIDDTTVNALLSVCREEATTFQQYFGKKASLLGMDKLRRYDLYAPLEQSQRKYEYDVAVRLVLNALSEFSDELGGYARRVFEEGHVHSTLQPGKISGAFCSTISPDITPYVLVNYTGESRDVFTLAHELGHAVHSVAAGTKSILVQHAPLPLAETASTFSEMLLYDFMSTDMDAAEESAVLSSKLDDLYATISRQAFFTMFEIQAHDLLSEGATPGRVSDAYLETLQEQFGDSISLSEDFKSEWLAIPHFYHSPFYCYSYSFGNLLAASLFQRYKKEGAGLAKTYVSILAAGGSQKPEKLMEACGFDIGSSNFWREGFAYVRSLVGRLESL